MVAESFETDFIEYYVYSAAFIVILVSLFYLGEKYFEYLDKKVEVNKTLEGAIKAAIEEEDKIAKEVADRVIEELKKNPNWEY